MKSKATLEVESTEALRLNSKIGLGVARIRISTCLKSLGGSCPAEVANRLFIGRKTRLKIQTNSRHKCKANTCVDLPHLCSHSHIYGYTYIYICVYIYNVYGCVSFKVLGISFLVRGGGDLLGEKPRCERLSVGSVQSPFQLPARFPPGGVAPEGGLQRPSLPK